MTKLKDLKLGQTAFIKTINLNTDEELAIRLLHLGFLENEKIVVLKRTPFTGDALLISIRGTQIALTKREAELIEINL